MSTTLTIRNLDQTVKHRLRQQAALHQRSMEAEARDILARGLVKPPLTESADSTSNGKFNHLVGIWKKGLSTDELMELTRGDDIDDAYTRR